MQIPHLLPSIMSVRPVTIYSPQPLSRRDIGIAYMDEDHKQFKRFCNTLRCPLCSCQLDGPIYKSQAELYCVTNNAKYMCQWFTSNAEYVCRWTPNRDEPQMECLKFWYYPYEYVISVQHQTTGNFLTVVNRYDMDVVPIHKASTRVELFSHKGCRLLAFRRRMGEAEFLKKLKTYTVFS